MPRAEKVGYNATMTTSKIASMTGFARTEGSEAGVAWAWELRSVNGRSFDLRLRLPTGFEALDAPLREAAGAVLRRGNVTANLTFRREDRPGLLVDPDALEQMFSLLSDLARRVPDAPAPRLEAVLALPGVLRGTPQNGAPAASVLAAVRSGFALGRDRFDLCPCRDAGRRSAGVSAGKTVRAGGGVT